MCTPTQHLNANNFNDNARRMINHASCKECWLVFFVRAIAGCDGCVCWLWVVVQAPHTHKFNKISANILGIAGKLLERGGNLGFS